MNIAFSEKNDNGFYSTYEELKHRHLERRGDGKPCVFTLPMRN